MKKISLILIVIVVMTLLFSCSRVEAGPMSDLTGTYQLTTYYREYNDATEDKKATKTEFLQDKNIEMYLVITGESIGYISYKDNENTLSVKEVNLQYQYDSENVDYISTISYTLPNVKSSELIQNGWENLGFVNDEHALNINYAKIETTGSCAKNNIQFNTKYRDHIYFKRVSRDVDLTYIKNKYGEVKAINLALSKLSDKYVFPAQWADVNNIPAIYSDYIFEAFEFSSDRTTVKKYYALKSDRTLVTKELQVEVTYSEDKLNIDKLIFDGITYKFNGSYIYVEESGETIKTANFFETKEDLLNYGNAQIQEYQE